ncbi:MAG: hypothetical protein Q9177_002173 [Variospora cf. flavescens]
MGQEQQTSDSGILLNQLIHLRHPFTLHPPSTTHHDDDPPTPLPGKRRPALYGLSQRRPQPVTNFLPILITVFSSNHLSTTDLTWPLPCIYTICEELAQDIIFYNILHNNHIFFFSFSTHTHSHTPGSTTGHMLTDKPPPLYPPHHLSPLQGPPDQQHK